MWSAASEGYKGDILKVAFENFNIDATGPGILSGYELWLGFDWFGASNGLVGGHGNQPRSKPGFCQVGCGGAEPSMSFAEVAQFPTSSGG